MDMKEAESQITSLRAELKQWEKTFAFRNNSQKPSREDIKQNPAIGLFDYLFRSELSGDGKFLTET